MERKRMLKESNEEKSCRVSAEISIGRRGFRPCERTRWRDSAWNRSWRREGRSERGRRCLIKFPSSPFHHSPELSTIFFSQQRPTSNEGRKRPSVFNSDVWPWIRTMIPNAERWLSFYACFHNFTTLFNAARNEARNKFCQSSPEK